MVTRRCVTMSAERCSPRQDNMVTQQRDHATRRSTLMRQRQIGVYAAGSDSSSCTFARRACGATGLSK